VHEEDVMKYAYSTLACPGWSLDQMIDAALRLGYDALELRLLDGRILDPVADQELIEQAVARCRAAGVEVCAIDTSCRLNYSGFDEMDRSALELANWIRLASGVQVPLLRVFGGETSGPDGAAADEAEVDARVTGVLRQAAPQAERAGVILALETHDIFASALRVGRVLNQVESPSVGALWDTLHPYRMGERPAQVLAALGDRLVHVHVKDARRDRADSEEWAQTLLGEGEVPVAEALDLLRRHGYSGYVSAEWEKKWHPDLAEPEIALPQHIGWLRELDSVVR
jgi:fatty-acyl-CoA synthase